MGAAQIQTTPAGPSTTFWLFSAYMKYGKQASFRKVNMTARMICVPTISLSFRIAVVFRSWRLKEKMPLLAHNPTRACKTQVMCSGPTWLFPPSRTVHENTADCWEMSFCGVSFCVCLALSFLPSNLSLLLVVICPHYDFLLWTSKGDV